MPEERWVDITEALRKGQACLKLGEMAHTSTFAVEQGMTAIQLGDKRMDVTVDENHHLPSVLASEALWTDLSTAQVAQLLDCLTAKLLQWWEGKNLQQTVYTSLHMLAQDKLEGAPMLQAGTALISALVSISKHIIQSSSVIHVRPAHESQSRHHASLDEWYSHVIDSSREHRAPLYQILLATVHQHKPARRKRTALHTQLCQTSPL
jgi:Mak10 subunit, NatC N(alpha)-terminal acetyltransferase